MDNFSYVIITPVRNEEDNIERTIHSVLNQTICPSQWIIVDDGSTDNTPHILKMHVSDYPWIKTFTRENRGHRSSGTGVMESFIFGIEQITEHNWDFLVKLDADMSFDTKYFENIISKFVNNPNLGIGGGTILININGRNDIERPKDPKFHVRGATKFYRKECFLQIQPFVVGPGWDTVDELKANMLGWTTKTFKDLYIYHNKLTGIADGSFKNSVKNGLANYVTGYSPIFMFFKCLLRIFERPHFVITFGLLCGYIYGYISNSPQVNNDLKSYIRSEQRKQLLFRDSLWS